MDGKHDNQRLVGALRLWPLFWFYRNNTESTFMMVLSILKELCPNESPEYTNYSIITALVLSNSLLRSGLCDYHWWPLFLQVFPPLPLVHP